MKTDELREKYLDFFVSKGHRLCPSDVLVPKWDKSVLFTPAGMNPFKDHFLGKVKLEFTRATSCQKCLRTGDIDNVGRTAYHHTFFEMLGNFSFGDYFKREAIQWAWEFLTAKQWLGLDPDRLSVTVYLDDDEAAGFWQNDIGLPTSRIQRLDENENFWPAGAPSSGPDGVCGPCSEIYYHPADGTKEVEVWNLVFTQFNREGDPPGNLKPLPSQNIDTGMGLERIAAQLQGVPTNYHIDILRPIVEAAAQVCGVPYVADSENGRRLRRITDHVRACTFAIHENVYPGAAREEYVVRRLLRRAALDGRQMQQREPFLFRLVPEVARMMQRPYPELSETVERVADVIRREEAAFLGNIDEGLARIERILKSGAAAGNVVDGRAAAELYQTHGVPPEMFEQIAIEQGFRFDWEGYRAAMKVHSEASGKLADTVMGSFGPVDQIKAEVKATPFVGYELESSPATVRGLVNAGARAAKLEPLADAAAEQLLVLDRTPFYAESGGQVGDSGEIRGPNGVFSVRDTQKDGDVWIHSGHCTSGTISEGDAVTATVDTVRRNAIRRAHTATHILHFALQQHVGSHAQQRGSRVTPDLLRFDFSNPAAVGEELLASVEQESVRRIGSAAPVTAEILPLSAARQRGAMMLFGEKYPDPVRMISVGEFSRELCGGTHVGNSAEIGGFEIITEEGISAGTRRIEALTGDRASEHRERLVRTWGETVELAGSFATGLVDAVSTLARSVKELRKQSGSGKPHAPAGPHSGRPAVPPPDYATIRHELRCIARALNVPLAEVADRVRALVAERDRLLKDSKKESVAAGPDAADLIRSAQQVDGVWLITRELPDGNPNQMRQLIDQVRQQLQPVAVFLAGPAGTDKVILVAGLSRDLVAKGLSAGDWVRETAPVVGGGGGGKPDLAQAGGTQPQNIRPALQAAADYLLGCIRV